MLHRCIFVLRMADPRARWHPVRMALASLSASALCMSGLAPAARAHALDTPLRPEARTQAIGCLTLAIAYEAGFEPIEGQRAVAEVVLNRVHSPGFPKTVCEVVFQGSTRRTGCQFTFTCDGALRRRLPDPVLAAARAVAAQAIDGDGGAALVGGATHYHAYYVSPHWAPELTRITQIGAHIFYRRPGAAGVPLSTATRAGQAMAIASKASAAFAPWGLAPPTGPAAPRP